MFNFENKHITQVQIDSNLSRANALKYVDKLVDAFAILHEIEALLGGLPANKKLVTDCLVTTAKIEGKDFHVKLVFSPDSEKPHAAEIIMESE